MKINQIIKSLSNEIKNKNKEIKLSWENREITPCSSYCNQSIENNLVDEYKNSINEYGFHVIKYSFNLLHLDIDINTICSYLVDEYKILFNNKNLPDDPYEFFNLFSERNITKMKIDIDDDLMSFSQRDSILVPIENSIVNYNVQGKDVDFCYCPFYEIAMGHLFRNNQFSIDNWDYTVKLTEFDRDNEDIIPISICSSNKFINNFYDKHNFISKQENLKYLLCDVEDENIKIYILPFSHEGNIRIYIKNIIDNIDKLDKKQLITFQNLIVKNSVAIPSYSRLILDPNLFIFEQKSFSEKYTDGPFKGLYPYKKISKDVTLDLKYIRFYYGIYNKTEEYDPLLFRYYIKQNLLPISYLKSNNLIKSNKRDIEHKIELLRKEKLNNLFINDEDIDYHMINLTLYNKVEFEEDQSIPTVDDEYDSESEPNKDFTDTNNDNSEYSGSFLSEDSDDEF